MSPEYLTSLLAAGAADDSSQSHDCPDEHQIAGYVDGGLAGPVHEQIGLHIADCGRCLRLVGLLCREQHADAIEPVLEQGVAPVPAAATTRMQRQWRLAPQWAAAAALVLAVPLLFQFSRNLDRGAEGQGRPDAHVTRTLAPAATGLQVLYPDDEAAVDPRGLAFRWTEVAGTPYYDVRIVTDAGDVVIQQRVTGTTWRLPPELNLQPGAEYFVHIDAYPSGDKAMSSDHVPFRVSE